MCVKADRVDTYFSKSSVGNTHLIMLLLAPLIFLVGTSHALLCNYDNCLNAFVRTSTLANPFCSTYTKSPDTATKSLPAYATTCKNQPSRISSACSCLLTISMTLASTTCTSSSPTVILTCHAGVFKGHTFAQKIAGGNDWIVALNQASGQTVNPIWGFPGTTPPTL